ncbi:MAG: hypothetical protein QCI00_02545, partial [Candidatus Thermoplasmatota archaeon]|nr:hypothetical protein [Candidatus Thermoplasmatota archaeon]
ILFSYAHIHGTSWKKSWLALAYVLFASTAAFAYWILVATPVYRSFMGRLFTSSNFVILGFYSIIILGFLYSMYSKQIKNQFIQTRFSLPSISLSKKIIIIFCILLVASLVSLRTGIPGVYVSLTPLAVFYSIPMILLVSFSLAGFSLLSKQKNGYFIKGWIIALLGSFFLSILSARLLPDRHLEYLIVPLCVPAALSIHHLIKNHKLPEMKTFFSFHKIIQKKESLQPHIRPFLIPVIVACIIVANTMTAYSAIDALDSLDERVSEPCINVMEWMKGNISSDSVIATDHRLSMLCWANNFNFSYGETNATWISDNLSKCLSELQRFNITHILIDDIMNTKLVSFDVGRVYYMTNSSYEKFLEEPFTLIYRNATTNAELEETHWVELYELNYSKISK